MLTVFLVAITWLATLILADDDLQPLSIFRSRPDLEAPVLTIVSRVSEKQSPGYYFVSPYQAAQDGVYIYDNNGDLIYSSFGSDGSGVSHNPQTCQYQGSTHLCFYQGRQMVGWGHGHGVIVDQHYRTVRSVEPSGSYQASSDMHEFRLIDNGKSALMTQYIRSVYDLCEWPLNLCDGLGYIQSGVFQEIDVESGKPVFTWNSLDHIHPRESWVLPSTTEIAGSGQHPTSPWDYFHINSVDKNEQGDYLISARHTSAVYKISGKDGHIIWRLNGYASDYHLAGNLSFSSQHDARFISDNETTTVISLFDNASNGYNITKPRSQGLIISLHHPTKLATLLTTQDPPNGTGHSSHSQGNFQLLPSGNRLMSYGSDAFLSEHDSAGTTVFYAYLALTSTMNYRAHKFTNWVGRPLTKPALWTFSKYGTANSTQQEVRSQVESLEESEYIPSDEGMTVYMSWNGATEVVSWRIFVSSSSSSSEFTELTTIPKSGFETIYRHPFHPAYKRTYVQALDVTGEILGESDVVDTFVPNEKMRDGYCDWLACRFMPSDEERERERLGSGGGLGGEIGEVDGVDDGADEVNARWVKHAGLVLVAGLVMVAGLVTVVTRWVWGRRGGGGGSSLFSSSFRYRDDDGGVSITTRVKDWVVGRLSERLARVGRGGDDVGGGRRSVSYKALRLDDVYDDGRGVGDGI